MNDVGLPPGWTETSIGDLVDRLQYGFTATADSAQDGPRFLRITDLDAGRIDWSTVPGCALSTTDFDKYRLFTDDIVFARTGSIEKAARLVNPPEAVFASYLIRGRPLLRDLAAWLGLFVGSFSYVNQTKKLSAGIGRANVNAKNLARVRVVLPPQPEQQRIVEVIDSYLTRLDDAVASLKRVQAKLKAYRASVLKAAAEGRLVPIEATLARAEKRNYEPAEVLLSRILKDRRCRWEEDELAKLKAAGKTPSDDKWKANYKERVSPDTSTLPKLPKGWCWTTVEMLASNKQGSICAGPFGTIFKAKDFRDTGVPIIFLRHVKPDRFLKKNPTFMDKAKWNELFRDYSVYGGELLVTKLGDPPGDCAVFPPAAAPSMLTPDVMKLELDARLAVSRYAMHYINSTVARRYAFGAAFGTTRLRLTLPLFRAMPVPLPPLAEQERIVEQIDRLLTVVDATDASVERDRTRCDRLRQAILKWAFEGKLVDQNSADEPAERLLARVRANRARAAPTKKNRGRTAKGAP